MSMAHSILGVGSQQCLHILDQDGRLNYNCKKFYSTGLRVAELVLTDIDLKMQISG